MRVGVNLLWCVPGDVGGSEEYLVRQLLGLADAAPDLAAVTTLFVLPAFTAAHPDLSSRYPMTVAPFDGVSRRRRVMGEAGWLRGASRGVGLTHHGGGTAPVAARHPYVVTIHDLQYRTFPQYFHPAKLAYLRVMMRRSGRGAARIAVPTQYVRGTVVDAFGVRPERVVVVPHGVEAALRSTVTPPAVLRQRYGLGNGPYVMYPAITHPHKNHRLLVELLAGPWAGRDLRVVCTGGRGAAEDVVAGCADPRLVRLGRVPDADRNGLIAAAAALVFPSTYEGFGAPLIEAMTLGTPIVCSDAASLPEVAGDAAVVRPPTVDAWADALDEVERRRADLVPVGYRRAEQFTALRSGGALAAVYREVLA